MNYEKQIKDAKTIGEEWIKKSKSYLTKINSLNRNHNNGARVKKLESDIKKGLHEGGLDEDYRRELDKEHDRLGSLKEACDQLLKSANTWMLAEPRESMKFIGKKLNLGPVGSDAYEAVSKSLTRQLLEVSESIQQILPAGKDMITELDHDLAKIDSLRKVLAKEIDQQESDRDAWQKRAETHKKLCEDIITNLKMKGDVPDTDEKKVKARDAKINQQKYQLFENKLAQIPKNLARIKASDEKLTASVPRIRIKEYLRSKTHKDVETLTAVTNEDLLKALVFYKDLIKKFKQWKVV